MRLAEIAGDHQWPEVLLEEDRAECAEGKHPDQLACVVDDGKGDAPAPGDDAQHLGEGGALRDRLAVPTIDGGNGDPVEHLPIRGGMQALALGGETKGVDRLGLERGGDRQPDDRRDERRDGDRVALRHLEEQEDGRERRVRGGSEERAEADERIGPARAREAGQ